MERRSLVNGAFVAGLTALAAPGRADARVAETAGEAAGGDDGAANAVAALQGSVERMFRQIEVGPWTGIQQIRKQQHDWLKTTHKYPDFIEVGINVWDSVHDWHVRHQQPISMTRLTDGRYVMSFMFTTLLLRSDMPVEFVGYPFDAEARRTGQQ